MKKKKGKKKQEMSDFRDKLNPLISIEENRNESLYAIVDFSLPCENQIRRVISKKNGDGTINAVTYIGKVGADRTCISKKNIMTMENVLPEKFWESIKLLTALYRIRGATVEIRNYEGKTMSEAASLMRMQDNAKVRSMNEEPAQETGHGTIPPSDLIH